MLMLILEFYNACNRQVVQRNHAPSVQGYVIQQPRKRRPKHLNLPEHSNPTASRPAPQCFETESQHSAAPTQQAKRPILAEWKLE